MGKILERYKTDEANQLSINMDTPVKTQIENPLSTFQESPVFNYINNLSPIKPVNSTHTTQTFNSMTVSSPPSVFTSPHISSHKGSRFLIRHNRINIIKSEKGKNLCTSEDVTQHCDNSSELHGNLDSVVSISGAKVDNDSESLKFSIELPQTLKYDRDSTYSDSTTRCSTKTDFALEMGHSFPIVQDSSKKGSSEGEEACLDITSQTHEICEWGNLMSEAAELLFNFPCDTDVYKEFNTSRASQFSQDVGDNVTKMQFLDMNTFSEQQESEDPSSQLGETVEWDDISMTHGSANLHQSLANDVDGKFEDNQHATSLHLCVPRRCLDFETITAHLKKINGDGSTSNNTSLLSHSNEVIGSKDNHLAPAKSGPGSSRYNLPGIGLHLNAIATSKESSGIKHEILPSGSQQRTLTSLSGSFQFPTTGQELVDEPLSSASVEVDIDGFENNDQLTEDAYEDQTYVVNSPRRKRRRTEDGGESEACKRCNCKKSKCLKLYCECFAAGVYCIEPCSCHDCFNKPIHEDTVLTTRRQIESRNPLAFAPKVIRSSESIPESGEESNKTPASARHKRGCNCKKSNCLKKYCECYQGGVGCSVNCRCEGCKNAYGLKDGSLLVTETELDEETETSETIERIDKQENPFAVPSTPLQLSRRLLQLPFPSNGKPPPSIVVSETSSQFNAASTRYEKPNIMRSKMEKHCQNAQDDEIPEILRGNSLPNSVVTTASPNKKRVTPPYCEFVSSPSLRSGRKLILQSIPSFPSLNTHQ